MAFLLQSEGNVKKQTRLLDLSVSITKVPPANPMHTPAAVRALPPPNSDTLFFHNCLAPIQGNSQLHNQKICIFPPSSLPCLELHISQKSYKNSTV